MRALRGVHLAGALALLAVLATLPAVDASGGVIQISNVSSSAGQVSMTLTNTSSDAGLATVEVLSGGVVVGSAGVSIGANGSTQLTVQVEGDPNPFQLKASWEPDPFG